MSHRNLIIALTVGAIAGAAVSYFALSQRTDARFAAVVAPQRQDVDDISTAEAEVLRKGRYESLSSIDEILALPTDFAETEALYAVAGRSNSARVQDLLYQAAGIGNQIERRRVLGVLFSRLTEMDPKSALAISRAPAFAADRELEAFVWQAWGRLDLVGALRAAENEPPMSRHFAAQALYRSLNGLDSDDASIIATMLGVRPDRETRMQQLFVVASRSPADAVNFIESTARIQEQREYFGWLAQYVASTDTASPAAYTERITSSQNRRFFEQSFAMQQATFNPEQVLQATLDSATTHDSQMRVHAALRQLATTDPQRALDYLQQMPLSTQRNQYESSVMMAIARSDPEVALAWLRQNARGGDMGAIMTVLGTVAQVDPQLALAEIESISDPRRRNQMIASVASSLAQSDPQAATQLLAQITDTRNRLNIIGQLAAQWAQNDMDGALSWIASLTATEQQQAYQVVGQNFVHRDPEKAAELLRRLPAGSTRGLELQIAQSLARSQGTDAALAFAAQYKGKPEYERIEFAIVTATADTDTDAAMQMAARIEDSKTRDSAYANIIGREANNDPRQALQWLSSIDSERQQAIATAQIARSWYGQDSIAALAWIEGLPRGAARDDAIAALATSYNSSVEPPMNLIESIGDPRKKKQALLSRMQMMMRYDPAGASKMLQEIEMSAEERLRYEDMMNGLPFRY